MNNKDAFDFLSSKESVRKSSTDFLDSHNISEDDYLKIRRKFGDLKFQRDNFSKRNALTAWDNEVFYSKKIKVHEKEIVEVDLSQKPRKPLSELTMKAMRTRLLPLLDLMSTLAEKENFKPKTIAIYALQCISNNEHHRGVSSFCQEIINTGRYGLLQNQMSIPRAASLLDILAIGKRKYTDFRHLCKSENIQFPAYCKISQYRSDVILANEIGYFRNEIDSIIGVGLSYRRILERTVKRLFDTLRLVHSTKNRTLILESENNKNFFH